MNVSGGMTLETQIYFLQLKINFHTLTRRCFLKYSKSLLVITVSCVAVALDYYDYSSCRKMTFRWVLCSIFRTSRYVNDGTPQRPAVCHINQTLFTVCLVFNTLTSTGTTNNFSSIDLIVRSQKLLKMSASVFSPDRVVRFWAWLCFWSQWWARNGICPWLLSLTTSQRLQMWQTIFKTHFQHLTLLQKTILHNDLLQQLNTVFVSRAVRFIIM